MFNSIFLATTFTQVVRNEETSLFIYVAAIVAKEWNQFIRLKIAATKKYARSVRWRVFFR